LAITSAALTPVDELHGHEVVVVEFAEIIEPGDVRVIENGSGAGLGQEESLVGRLAFVLGQKALDHDELREAAEADAAREIDLGHPADGELPEEDVTAELRFHGDGHLIRSVPRARVNLCARVIALGRVGADLAAGCPGILLVSAHLPSRCRPWPTPAVPRPPSVMPTFSPRSRRPLGTCTCATSPAASTSMPMVGASCASD
jgi:hypothetical protein